MEEIIDGCLCGSGEHMVLACSGSSDVGQITDLVARKLRDNKVRKMNCLAVIGAGIEKSIENFKTKNILVIDGCPIDCGKRIMDKNGFTNYQYMRVTDLRYKKGETTVNDDVINDVYEMAKTFV
ncbi:MAG TPA: putative zinc-binding protein [Bacteroidales bacterium]|nr:putative zinc-binding protein [Bacteroidales bacterium]